MITVKETALKLSVSPSTVLRLIRADKLKAARNGTRWMLDEAEVFRFAANAKRLKETTLDKNNLLPGEGDFIAWMREQKAKKDAAKS
ncbi:MAG: helix-turn-helix domain-containing protein [Armatimonadetes bacterium]|nr:helix-turn-helix domain-containing protein [Armatimonadota bacterium]